MSEPIDPAGPSHRGGEYDDFVDWDARLAREAPFFRDLFEAAGVSRVIDVGAGSARHSIMFATWGLEVVAVDPDESMLAQAEENLVRFAVEIDAGGGSVRIVRGGFGGLAGLGLGRADALICTGNALPHVDGRDGLTEALADFGSVVAPGGVLVLHLLNHGRLLDGHVRVVPPKIRDTASGTKVFLRVIEYPEGGEYLDFDFLTLTRDASGEWDCMHRRSAHTAITAERLRAELPCAGFADARFLGGHDGHELTDADESVIVVAHRR